MICGDGDGSAVVYNVTSCYNSCLWRDTRSIGDDYREEDENM